MNFTFILNEEEAQKVIDTLGKEPFNEVVHLINNLHAQAYEQRQESTSVESETAAR